MGNIKSIYKNAKVIKISDKLFIADSGDFVLIIKFDYETIQSMVYYKSIHVYTSYQIVDLAKKPMKTVEEYLENQENSFSEAIEVIRGEFAKDKDLGSIYHTWQANLAMTIFDNSGIPVKQCNDIAKKFLDKLINGG